MSGGRVLVIDNSEAMRAELDSGLRNAGHQVLARSDGAGFEQDIARFRPDVLVMDFELPERDGIDLLGTVRRITPIGVVIVTARNALADRLRGFDGGADDYVVKPFEMPELVARVNALMRRMGRISSTIQIDDLIVDSRAGVVSRNGTVLALTATEFKLLLYMAQHRDHVLSRRQILSAVWGYTEYETNLVDVFVSMLRRKLELHGPRLLHTERGRGFVLRSRHHAAV